MDIAEAPFVERMVQKLGQKAGPSIVFGDPIERGPITVIPVARVRYGVGGGGGHKAERGGSGGEGGGAGMEGIPIGYIEISNGRAVFRPIIDANVLIRAAAIALVVGLWMAGRVSRTAIRHRRSE